MILFTLGMQFLLLVQVNRAAYKIDIAIAEKQSLKVNNPGMNAWAFQSRMPIVSEKLKGLLQ